jgi:hypothetical protein
MTWFVEVVLQEMPAATRQLPLFHVAMDAEELVVVDLAFGQRSLTGPRLDLVTLRLQPIPQTS